jgi:acetyltransferase-like isoleucine patch superfamily enzyme
MTKRHVDLPDDAQETIDSAIAAADQRLSDAGDTATAVQELLVDLAGDRQLLQRYRAGERLPQQTVVRLQSYNPRNVLTETDRWAEQPEADLRESRYLRYLWRAFDQLPLSNNIAFALPFRQLLADHLFAEAGDDLRLFGGIKIQCGHNIEMGDNVVVHNDVLLDDRGVLEIGDRVSVADRSHLHTHSHDIVDQTDVTTYRTLIEDDVRLGYDSMVGAGCRVGENAMVGTSAMVRGDVPDHHVAVGAPAESVRVKPGWESVAREPGPLPDNRDRRALEKTFPEQFEEFDEFGRELSPPDAPTVQ